MTIRHPYGGSGAHLLIDQAKPVYSVKTFMASPSWFRSGGHQKTKLLSGRDSATAWCFGDARCIDDACYNGDVVVWWRERCCG